ncbi:terpene synthase family protein [Chitinophaga nivalis]|uniref:Terpene synthase n=1 Tax=Chitinophaga nivalis TaxID=2991709 RepID=A0ABT3IS60_9BACT|nr:hypothetical protein [Chitinophaga nivalis]MCW3463540.1 hypothetical protein [Chitinophaga nivalis]MCW3486770.1 hypothetical protein [Chitinophaga nivalis]
MNHLAIPDFHYPYPQTLSSLAFEAQADEQMWQSQSPLFTQDFLKRCSTSRFSFLAARCFPHSDITHLTTLGRQMLMLFILDDAYSLTTVADYENRLERIRSLAAGQPLLPSDNDVLRMQHSVNERFRQTMSTDWANNRVLMRIAEVIEYDLKELPFQLKQTSPTREEYISIREKSVGMLPSVDMVEYTHEFELPWEIIEHPSIKQLAAASCFIIAYSNDLFSLYKEQEEHDVFNMILVLQQHENYTPSGAIAAVNEMHDEVIAQFKALRHALPDFKEWNRDVQRYVRGIEDVIIGNYHWSIFDTHRYHKKK